MLFKATLEDLNRWSMNYIVRKGILSLYRITGKRATFARVCLVRLRKRNYVDYSQH